jgi:hypothetical protein
LVVLSWRFQLERAEESVHEEKEALRRTQRATQLQLQVGSSLFHPRLSAFSNPCIPDRIFPDPLHIFLRA